MIIHVWHLDLISGTFQLMYQGITKRAEYSFRHFGWSGLSEHECV